jgi:hypothetical protein
MEFYLDFVGENIALNINIGQYYRVRHIILGLYIGQRTISNHFHKCSEKCSEIVYQFF